MLTTVGDPAPRVRKETGGYGEKLSWEATSTGVYKEDFEAQFLLETADYYRAHVAGMLQWTCPEYLNEVERRLQAEATRIERYLHRSSSDGLLAVTQRELILETAQRVVEMQTGMRFMLEHRKDE